MPPLIVTLRFDEISFASLDGLRRKYFPAARNFIAAHVSLFHALPAEERNAVESSLSLVAARVPMFEVAFTQPKRLGSGFALAVEGPELYVVHRDLAAVFAAWLTPQDRQRFSPHVTLMNKASRAVFEQGWAEFTVSWTPQKGIATGLCLWSYLGGPWRLEREFAFATNVTSLAVSP